tara:strand:- start:4152 stop:4889 length:738 start_codon:yes stop_codon:yes gene_type:complete
MADKFFNNFPEIQYQLDSGEIIFIKDFFRKSKIEQESVNALIEPQLYSLVEGERPDTLASKIYGNSNLHWTFFLVNDIENYYDWHKDVNTFENYINKKYPGQYAIGDATTDIVSAKSFISDTSHKFLLGEKVTSASAEGRIITVEPEKFRIAIENVTGSFVANETITGKVSTNSFTPTTVINHRDGVQYYSNADGLKRNTSAVGYTSTTIYNQEFEDNETKRHIKIISPRVIGTIVRRFEKVMTS